MSVKIKICGITNYEDATICASEGANAVGFIFYKKSPRFIMPKEAKRIINKLPCFISRVGVFVDEKEDTVLDIAKFCNLDTLQFHGSETNAYCASFRNNFKVIKSFFPKEAKIISKIKRYKVDATLLDIPFKEKSASLKTTLDFRVVRKISKDIKFLILSGGLSCLNVGPLIKKLAPFAVDVARGVEKFPGKKDKAEIRNFIRAVKKAEKHA